MPHRFTSSGLDAAILAMLPDKPGVQMIATFLTSHLEVLLMDVIAELVVMHSEPKTTFPGAPQVTGRVTSVQVVPQVLDGLNGSADRAHEVDPGRLVLLGNPHQKLDFVHDVLDAL